MRAEYGLIVGEVAYLSLGKVSTLRRRGESPMAPLASTHHPTITSPLPPASLRPPSLPTSSIIPR